jgi:hypothetical protein
MQTYALDIRIFYCRNLFLALLYHSRPSPATVFSTAEPEIAGPEAFHAALVCDIIP